MTVEKLIEILNDIQQHKSETQTLEIKCAAKGCPRKLFDTLSSFSNQDDGGIIIFGVDEDNDFQETGVYDPQDLQKKVNSQCFQMQPVVRPLFTVAEKDGKIFVSAEIPSVDLSERPCYYKGVGRIKGSYIRSGDSDEPMTEYEIYSYEAFRKKYQDDIRTVPRATMKTIDTQMLEAYVKKLKEGKPNLSNLSDDTICELMSITRDGVLTLTAVMLFCPYPQAFFPGFSIIAMVIPGTEMGETGDLDERFTDNERIEGTIPQMLETALQFVKRNMRHHTIIDPDTGRRADRTDYPLTAVREAILNALVHRDYSMHTEAMPVQLIMFDDRIEIRSPGGIYGRIKADQLGKVQPDTRNPVLALALEVMGITENRYSGIPTIRREMAGYGLKEPEFSDERGSFKVCFRKEPESKEPSRQTQEERPGDHDLLLFCITPRTKKEICEFLGLNSTSYAIQKYVMPLVEEDRIRMSMPDKPKSPKQLFFTNRSLLNES